MYSTKYVKAKDVSIAASIVTDSEDGKFLAGGMTLIPTMKQRLASPDCLVDLAGCGLTGIEDEGATIRIGAMSRHVDVAESAVIQREIPAIAGLASQIGDSRRVIVAQLVGHLLIMIPLLLSICPGEFGGTIHTQNRSIVAEDFLTGMFETDLEEDEIIIAISFPTIRQPT